MFMISAVLQLMTDQGYFKGAKDLNANRINLTVKSGTKKAVRFLSLNINVYPPDFNQLNIK